MLKTNKKIVKTWEQQNRQWRDPGDVIGLFEEKASGSSGLFEYKTQGDWWSLLAELRIRLIISREYEHLLLMLGARLKSPEISYLRLPHPSGIAVDRKNRLVYVASTRNPNQVFTFRPADGVLARKDQALASDGPARQKKSLVPVRSNFYPGSLYIHDLSLIDGKLYATATGHNMVVELPESGGYVPVWWPKCVATQRGVRRDLNYIQLNAIAAGKSLRDSFFSASASRVSRESPRDPDFPVDRRGVIMSGKSRISVCGGLTRPHSARLHEGKVWVDNSGYGEFGYVAGGRFLPIIRLPGWTRGLCFYKGMAFVGTSRILPRFERFAPGLQAEQCVCSIQAVDLKSAKVVASIVWPQGNQIFAIEWMDRNFSDGFPNCQNPETTDKDVTRLFYAYR